MDNSICFSKIVATPTLNSWSQAYNAGKLFAVLSLEKTQELNENIESLNVFGKNLLERLEQEFFIIENKNLESIKKAVSATFAQEAENIAISFAAGALVDNILYLFGLGNAKVFIKRGANLGLALNAEKADSKNIASSSGFLKEADLIVLATDAFSQVITRDDLDSSLNEAQPTEIAESLAPKIHKAENGKISAIIIKYGKPQVEEDISEEDAISKPESIIQEEKAEKPTSFFNKYLILLKAKLKKSNFKVQSTKKVFLLTTIAIVAVLSASIFLAIQKQNNEKMRAVFSETYPQAQKKYEEGQSLVDLNKNLARDSLTASQKIIQDNLDRFPAKSKEMTQMQDLLKKVESGLNQVSPIDKSGLDRSKLSVTVENGSGTEGVAGKAAAVLKEFGYNVTSTGNADNYNYKGVTIKVRKENSKFLDLLKKDLSKDYAVTSTSTDLSSDSPTDALIIIGK